MPSDGHLLRLEKAKPLQQAIKSGQLRRARDLLAPRCRLSLTGLAVAN